MEEQPIKMGPCTVEELTEEVLWDSFLLEIIKTEQTDQPAGVYWDPQSPA